MEQRWGRRGRDLRNTFKYDANGRPFFPAVWRCVTTVRFQLTWKAIIKSNPRGEANKGKVLLICVGKV